MTAEISKNYNELPDEDKKKYKTINQEGDFVEVGVVEDPEVAHRIALLENEAFGELEESVKKSDISADEILEKLTGKRLDYDEKSALVELLLENADLQRLKGKPIDDKIEAASKKVYFSFKYSSILTKKLVGGITAGDVSVVGELLKDEKLWADFDIMRKLENDSQRLQSFEICKKRVKAACLIIDTTQDLESALKMYSEVLQLADKESYSDSSDIEHSGGKLAGKLFESGDKKRLMDLVESDALQLSCLKRFLHFFGKEPQNIIDLVKSSRGVDDICYALKFVADPQLLSQLETEPGSLAKLKKEDREKVLAYARTIAKALVAGPKIIALSGEFKQDKTEFRHKSPHNKFVVGIQGDKYVIAWSNMDDYENHRDIFNTIGKAEAKSGGYMGIDEQEDKIVIRIVRCSGDYGFYSKELLERFRGSIEKSFQSVLGGKKLELVIRESTEYGEE